MKSQQNYLFKKKVQKNAKYTRPVTYRQLIYD